MGLLQNLQDKLTGAFLIGDAVSDHSLIPRFIRMLSLTNATLVCQ